MRIALWSVSQVEFEEWREFVGAIDTIRTHADYAMELERIAHAARREGHEVDFIEMTVSEMRSALISDGLKNTPENRAAIIAGARPNNVLGIKFGGLTGTKKQSVSSSWIPKTLAGSGSEPVENGNITAAAIRAIEDADSQTRESNGE